MIRIIQKIVYVSIITGIFFGSPPLWAAGTESIPETKLPPIQIEFLVSPFQRTANTPLITGKHGMKLQKDNDLILRFINRERGYVYLININNKGLYILFPFAGSTVIPPGAHELKKDGVLQKYSLKNAQGDQYFVAIFSRTILDPEEHIAPLFKDLSWLKKGSIDTALLEKKKTDIAVDYFAVYVP